MCFLALFGPKPLNYYFDAFHSFHNYLSLRTTKTRTEDYNRAKYALNFSFVGLLLQVILLGTSWFWTLCNKNKNVYNIRPNAAKFLSIIVVTSVFLCLLFLVSLLHEINH